MRRSSLIWLAARAADILSQVAEAESDLEAHRNVVAGRVTVATFATAARGLAPGALGLLADAHPQLEVRLVEQEPELTMSGLERGDADVGVVTDWVNSPLAVADTLDRVLLMRDPADLALPADHPSSSASSVALADMAARPWISSSFGSSCHDWLLQNLRSQGVEPTIAHRVAEHSSQLALVAAGRGTAIVPRLGRGSAPDGVTLVTVHPTMTRQVYAAWRKDTARRPSVRAVVDAFRQVAAESSETQGAGTP